MIGVFRIFNLDFFPGKGNILTGQYAASPCLQAISRLQIHISPEASHHAPHLGMGFLLHLPAFLFAADQDAHSGSHETFSLCLLIDSRDIFLVHRIQTQITTCLQADISICGHRSSSQGKIVSCFGHETFPAEGTAQYRFMLLVCPDLCRTAAQKAPFSVTQGVLVPGKGFPCFQGQITASLQFHFSLGTGNLGSFQRQKKEPRCPLHLQRHEKALPAIRNGGTRKQGSVPAPGPGWLHSPVRSDAGSAGQPDG